MPRLKWEEQCEWCLRRIRPTDNHVILHAMAAYGTAHPLHLRCLTEFVIDNDLPDFQPLEVVPRKASTEIVAATGFGAVSVFSPELFDERGNFVAKDE